VLLTLAQVWTADWMIELWDHVPVLILRTILTFITVLVVVRWTGKRSIANLAPFDLAMVIMIGEVAAIPISELKVDLLHGILPVGLIGGLHVVTTWLALKSKVFERWTEGSPTMLVKDGQVLRKNLAKERVSMADLMTALRHKEVTRITDVQQAWIEHAGGISVIRKHEADAATPRDLDQALQLSQQQEQLDLRRLIEEVMQIHGARMREELAELLRQDRVKSGG
jgi:uncharacterized membrane protein YcaP (DUF421 family)